MCPTLMISIKHHKTTRQLRTTVAGNAILARYPALTAAVHVKPLTFKELPGAYSMQPWARKVAPVATVVKWPLVTLSSRDPPRKSHRSQMGASINGGTPKWMIYTVPAYRDTVLMPRRTNLPCSHADDKPSPLRYKRLFHKISQVGMSSLTYNWHNWGFPHGHPFHMGMGHVFFIPMGH